MFFKDLCCSLKEVDSFLNSLCHTPQKCGKHGRKKSHFGWHFCTGTDDVELFLRGHKDC